MQSVDKKLAFSVCHHTDSSENADSGKQKAKSVNPHSGYGNGKYRAVLLREARHAYGCKKVGQHINKDAS